MTVNYGIKITHGIFATQNLVSIQKSLTDIKFKSFNIHNNSYIVYIVYPYHNQTCEVLHAINTYWEPNAQPDAGYLSQDWGVIIEKYVYKAWWEHVCLWICNFYLSLTGTLYKVFTQTMREISSILTLMSPWAEQHYCRGPEKYCIAWPSMAHGKKCSHCKERTDERRPMLFRTIILLHSPPPPNFITLEQHDKFLNHCIALDHNLDLIFTLYQIWLLSDYQICCTLFKHKLVIIWTTTCEAIIICHVLCSTLGMYWCEYPPHLCSQVAHSLVKQSY